MGNRCASVSACTFEEEGTERAPAMHEQFGQTAKSTYAEFPENGAKIGSASISTCAAEEECPECAPAMHEQCAQIAKSLTGDFPESDSKIGSGMETTDTLRLHGEDVSAERMWKQTSELRKATNRSLPNLSTIRESTSCKERQWQANAQKYDRGLSGAPAPKRSRRKTAGRSTAELLAQVRQPRLAHETPSPALPCQAPGVPSTPS